jgi:hypothetical protein
MELIPVVNVVKNEEFGDEKAVKRRPVGPE